MTEPTLSDATERFVRSVTVVSHQPDYEIEWKPADRRSGEIGVWRLTFAFKVALDERALSELLAAVTRIRQRDDSEGDTPALP